jgi:histidinol-phosphate phosphatase family protein
MPHQAVFLDRDRTIIEDPGYLADASAVKLLPGADLAIRTLRQAGYRVIVVTNQSGVARGLITEETLEKIHAELRRQLAAGGAHVDAIYYCPFHPEGTIEKYAMESPLRKPQPGMLLRAAGEFDLDLAASWMVGDGARDVEAGQRAGCRTIRIRGPEDAASGEEGDENVQADFTVRNVLEASRLILQAPPRKAAGRSPTAPPMRETSADARSDRQLIEEILRQVQQIRKDLDKG